MCRQHGKVRIPPELRLSGRGRARESPTLSTPRRTRWTGRGRDTPRSRGRGILFEAHRRHIMADTPTAQQQQQQQQPSEHDGEEPPACATAEAAEVAAADAAAAADAEQPAATPTAPAGDEHAGAIYDIVPVAAGASVDERAAAAVAAAARTPGPAFIALPMEQRLAKQPPLQVLCARARVSLCGTM